MMKRYAFLVLLLITFSFISAQEIIENTEKPLNKDAGRILKLREELRITDESGEFFFKYPSNLKVTSVGSILLQDEEQLLKFSPEGKFLQNLYKKGQGPGEISGEFEFDISKDEIFIYDRTNIKFLCININGDIVDELKINQGRYRNFIGLIGDYLVVTEYKYPSLRNNKSGLYEMDYSIFLVSKDGLDEKGGYVFKVTIFLAQGGLMSWDYFDTHIDKDRNKIYVSYSREYKIEVLDLNTYKISQTFRRKYPRVKYEFKYDYEKEFYKKFNPPEKKFERDIFDLFLKDDLLWVKTSTKDRNKGNLFDVFNREGEYHDNFYFPVEGEIIGVHGDFIFVVERTKDETLNVVKYRVLEKNS